MTDDQEPQPKRTPPPPRRKASPKRTPPLRRGNNGNGTTVVQEPQAGAEPSLGALISAAVSAAMAPVHARLDGLERGSTRFIEMEPEPTPDARAVNPDALDPFTRKLWEERTHDTPQDYGGDREAAYNIPLRWYLKNDGTYVQLQGDAKNRAYYQDKGFHPLSADEVAEYEKLQPSIVAHQREKAHLITAIRRLIDTDAALVGHRGDGDADAELDLSSTDQLRQTWRSLCAETSQPERALPAMKRWRSEGRSDKNMTGVETTPRSITSWPQAMAPATTPSRSITPLERVSRPITTGPPGSRNVPKAAAKSSTCAAVRPPGPTTPRKPTCEIRNVGWCGISNQDNARRRGSEDSHSPDRRSRTTQRAASASRAVRFNLGLVGEICGSPIRSNGRRKLGPRSQRTGVG